MQLETETFYVIQLHSTIIATCSWSTVNRVRTSFLVDFRSRTSQKERISWFLRLVLETCNPIYASACIQQADLATERERHLTTEMPAERTKLDFLCPIRRSAIGQASCLNCERSRQLTFPLCCYVYVGTERSQRWRVVRKTSCRCCISRQKNDPYQSNCILKLFEMYLKCI